MNDISVAMRRVQITVAILCFINVLLVVRDLVL